MFRNPSSGIGLPSRPTSRPPAARPPCAATDTRSGPISSAAAMAARTDFSSVTFVDTYVTLSPSSSASALPLSSATSAMTTAAPAAASRRTVAPPRPPVPPVTIALFPSSRTEPSTSEMTFLHCEGNVSARADRRRMGLVVAGPDDPATDDGGRHQGGAQVGEHLVERSPEHAQVGDRAWLDLSRRLTRRQRITEEQLEAPPRAHPLAGAEDGAGLGTPQGRGRGFGHGVRSSVGRV